MTTRRHKAGVKPSDMREVGVKYDTEKARFDLLPWLALEAVAVVLRDGASKYSEHNWRKGIHWSRLLRAAIGHLGRVAIGENYDRETKLPHLAHAACCVLFLLEYYLVSRVTREYDRLDNRYKLESRVQDEYTSLDMFRDKRERDSKL